MNKRMTPPKPPKGELSKDTIAFQNKLIGQLQDRILTLMETREKLEQELVSTENARKIAVENVMDLRGQVRSLVGDIEAEQARVARSQAFHIGYRTALADKETHFLSEPDFFKRLQEYEAWPDSVTLGG